MYYLQYRAEDFAAFDSLVLMNASDSALPMGRPSGLPPLCTALTLCIFMQRHSRHFLSWSSWSCVCVEYLTSPSITLTLPDYRYIQSPASLPGPWVEANILTCTVCIRTWKWKEICMHFTSGSHAQNLHKFPHSNPSVLTWVSSSTVFGPVLQCCEWSSHAGPGNTSSAQGAPPHGSEQRHRCVYSCSPKLFV